MIKILIFGASEGGSKVLNMLNQDNVEILSYVDNDIKKIGSSINGIKIIGPDKIGDFNFDYILIASIYHEEIFNQLIDLGVTENKIIKIYGFSQKTSRNLVKELYNDNQVYLSMFKKEEAHRFINNYFICNMNTLDKRRNTVLYSFRDYLLEGVDYVRTSTVELIAKEVYEKHIEGAIAELGVYRGDFTKVISTFFNDRKLYLFDTFEGFQIKDVEVEKSENYSNAKVGHLKDTDIETVLSKIEHKNDVYIKKGYFPDTAVGIDNESFAFVSIDVDLYKPTYDGLCFFYNRLSKGGYILIHDYNNSYYSGVKEAVNKFCKEKNVTCIPVSDYLGSAIITK